MNSDIVYGLGIDTGGTNTDAVIVDIRSNQLLVKVKARTTHEDLSIGLNEAVDNVLKVMGPNALKIGLVGVSTTLATNSILERKGGQVGLIGLGWTPDEGQDLGAKRSCFLAGGHDVRGRLQAALQIDKVEKAVADMVPEVDSIVVSSLFSVYNPTQEQEVKRLITKNHQIPVVMGHELTGELGIAERTVTAVLNASLIPVLQNFLQSVQVVMSRHGIAAPLMVCKGDGTLMNIPVALERPVDTILSGPAASASGGMILSDLDDCVVIDMGGTSTDIAIIEKGSLRNAPDGAMIGGWRTRVEAVDMWTFALGGDSEIRGSRKSGLLIGPERVAPLAFATLDYPSIKKKMEDLGEARFLMAVDRPHLNLSRSEQSIVDFLRTNGPSTLSELKDDLKEIHLLDMFIRSLRNRGAVFGIGLTPTDILHVSGQYTAGDVEAARQGVRLYSRALGLNEEDLVRDVTEMLSKRTAEELLKKLLTDNLETLSESPSMQGVIKLLSGSRASANLGLKAKIKYPIVGLGGPAKSFITPLADLLDVNVLIPEHYDVGNAVGAVCGRVSMFADVYVYPREKTYAVYSTFSPPLIFGSEHSAVWEAKAMATSHALERGQRAGGKDLKVQLVVEEEREKLADEPGKDALVQMHVRALAIGRPQEL